MFTYANKTTKEIFFLSKKKSFTAPNPTCQGHYYTHGCVFFPSTQETKACHRQKSGHTAPRPILCDQQRVSHGYRCAASSSPKATGGSGRPTLISSPEQGVKEPPTTHGMVKPMPYTTHRLVMLCDSTMYDQGVISFPLTQGTKSNRPMHVILLANKVIATR